MWREALAWLEFVFLALIDACYLMFHWNPPRDHRATDSNWFASFEDYLEVYELLLLAGVLVIVWALLW